MSCWFAFTTARNSKPDDKPFCTWFGCTVKDLRTVYKEYKPSAGAVSHFLMNIIYNPHAGVICMPDVHWKFHALPSLSQGTKTGKATKHTSYLRPRRTHPQDRKKYILFEMVLWDHEKRKNVSRSTGHFVRISTFQQENRQWGDSFFVWLSLKATILSPIKCVWLVW